MRPPLKYLLCSILLIGLTELENAVNEFVELIKATADVTEIKIELLTNEKLSCEI